MKATKPGASLGFYPRYGKRVLDLALTVPGLALLLPILAGVAVAVRATLGRPVLFRQERPGLGGEIFTLLKFRTMTDANGPSGEPLPDGQRLTRVGRLLRRTSLDELPSLLNVLRGDMSLVGPRPLLVRYTPYFTQEERQRFLVRPGITGLAQISGRNDLPWDERIAADVRYVRNCTLKQDAKILLKTIGKVLRRAGLREDPASGSMLNFDDERRLRASSRSAERVLDR